MSVSGPDRVEMGDMGHSSEDTPILAYNFDEDSDIEFYDSPQFTENRLKNKKKRYVRRMSEDKREEDILDKDDESVKEDFKEYMVKIRFGNDSPTISKTMGFLFTYPFAWIKFEEKEDSSFKISRQLDFKSADFLPVTNPMRWILSESGTGTAGRR